MAQKTLFYATGILFWATSSTAALNSMAAAGGAVPAQTLALLGQLTLASVALSATTEDVHAQMAPASQDDCNSFMTLLLGPLTTECADLARDLQTVATTSTDCKRVYDFSKPKLDGMCSNKCYPTMVRALDGMAKAGCSADGVTKMMCDQCEEGTACVEGVCRPLCSATKPCACNDECVNGSCQSSDQGGLQRTDMGTFGYKISLEHLCLKAPLTLPDTDAPDASTAAKEQQMALAKEDYCFSSVFNALEGLTPDVCDKLAATGCCAGTVMQYGVTCGLANDTVKLNGGAPMQLTALANFCPDVDFKTKCSNAPAYADGMCKVGYVDGPGTELPFPSLASFARGSFDMAGLYALAGGISFMCLLLLTVSILQKRGHVRGQAEAADAADAGKTNVSSPAVSPVASPIDKI